MVIVAVVIGLLGGFGAIFFRFAIRFFEGIFSEPANTHLTMPCNYPGMLSCSPQQQGA